MNRKRSGFTLLEMTLALGISGILMSAIWQLMGVEAETREAATLASQAYSVAQAGQSYINANNSTLLALTQLGSINAVARIKVTDSDTGDTTTSVQGSGYLPAGFVNSNSFGQTYQLYAQRQDGGAVGVDADDRLIGLLITSGGVALGDKVGTRAASMMGAAGGFIRTGGTVASGTSGGWSIDFNSSPGWSTTPGTAGATPGHLAVLTVLMTGATGMGSGGGASEIDDLDDGATDYSLGNVYLGEDAGTANTTGTSNTAVGYGALEQPSTYSNNTAVGLGAGSNIQGGENVVIGSEAGSGSAGAIGNQNVAIGSQAMRYSTGDRNVAVGYLAMAADYVKTDNVAVGYRAAAMLTTDANGNVAIGSDALYATTTGTSNVAVGAEALYVNISGINNTAVGYQAGDSITTGSGNIIIGNGADAPSATSSNQLNIGNTIYGDLNTDQVNIGSPTLVTGIGFDVGTNTSASRLSVGTTAQRPACTASLEGAQRWNSQTQTMEACTGGAWMQPTPAWTSVGPTPPTPPPGSGYFVLTETQWTGDLGGMSGANAKCLTELTTKTNWMGYATALANGQLVAERVKALICTATTHPTDSSGCEAPVASTSYFFARVGDASAGGAQVPVDSAQTTNIGSAAWTAPNYFNGSFEYWSNRGGSSTTIYSSAGAQPCCSPSAYTCNLWTDGTSSKVGYIGYSNSSSSVRRDNGTVACDQSKRLICMVHP